MVQVLAEIAAGDGVGQVAVGGRDQPNVDLDRFVGANPDDLALSRARKLDLRAQGDVADLVEEEGAAVGVLEPAFPLPVGAGERPLDVAEELAFQDVIGNAAQLRVTNGLDRRGLLLCMALATSPCPCRSRR